MKYKEIAEGESGPAAASLVCLASRTAAKGSVGSGIWSTAFSEGRQGAGAGHSQVPGQLRCAPGAGLPLTTRVPADDAQKHRCLGDIAAELYYNLFICSSQPSLEANNTSEAVVGQAHILGKRRGLERCKIRLLILI